MTVLEAIDARHSVRAYRKVPVPQDVRDALDQFADELNRKSGLDIVIVYDDPSGFDSALAHYGRFRNVSNYIVLKGYDSPDFEYNCGYYGEALVLRAQQLGLNTCWTAMTFNKKRVKELVPEGQKLCMAIALGYGETQGRPRKSKTVDDVTDGTIPLRYTEGVEAALKAPTAMNKQNFCFSEENGEFRIRAKGIGSWSKVDLGIAAYHFEEATGSAVRPK